MKSIGGSGGPAYRSVAVAALFSGLTAANAGIITSVPANMDHAPEGFGGWNLDNVQVQIVFADGTVDDYASFNPEDGSYMMGPANRYLSNLFDREFIDGLSGEIQTASLAGGFWPMDEPPGIKVLNDAAGVSAPWPVNCIMATTYLELPEDPESGYLDTLNPVQTSCASDSGAQLRSQIMMGPAALGDGAIDLVFNVEPDDTSRDYQLFQQISNFTGERLEGFTLEVGFGIGDSFQKASAVLAPLTELHLSVPHELWYFDELANFPDSLFAEADGVEILQDGFFDDQPAGFGINEWQQPGMLYDTLNGNFPLGSNYVDVPPGAGVDPDNQYQFGAWLPDSWLPWGIYLDADDNPETPAELQAWYGWNPDLEPAPGFSWMYGSNRDPDSQADDFLPLDPALLAQWTLDPRYRVQKIQDLIKMNLNYLVTVGDISTWPSYDDTTNPEAPVATFTLRINPTREDPATPPPGYVGEVPEPGLSFTDPAGAVYVEPTPEFLVGERLSLMVTDGNVGDPATVDTVEVMLSAEGGDSEVVTLTEISADRGVFLGSINTAYGIPTRNGGDGILYTSVGELVSVSYYDADDGTPDPDRVPAMVTAHTTAVGSTLCGSVSSNTILLASQNPYHMVCDVTVDPAVTLELEPGLTVLVEDGHSFLVAGELIVGDMEGPYVEIYSSNPQSATYTTGFTISGGTGSVSLGLVTVEPVD